MNMHVNLDIASYVKEHHSVKSGWQCIFTNTSWLRVFKSHVSQIWDTWKKKVLKVLVQDPCNHCNISLRTLCLFHVEKNDTWLKGSRTKQNKNGRGREVRSCFHKVALLVLDFSCLKFLWMLKFNCISLKWSFFRFELLSIFLLICQTLSIGNQLISASWSCPTIFANRAKLLWLFLCLIPWEFIFNVFYYKQNFSPGLKIKALIY